MYLEIRIPKPNSKKDVVKNKIADFLKAEKAYYQKTNFTWGFELFIDSDTPIERVASFSHDIHTEFVDEDDMQVLVTLQDPDEPLYNTNFQLVYRNESVNTPSVLAQIKGKEIALAVSLLVDMTPEKEVDKRKPKHHYGPDLESTNRYFKENEMLPQEYYFVLDRSYSMKGKPMEVAKEALDLFIRSLLPGSKFNIISFGNEFYKVFSSAKKYNEDTLNEAIETIKDFEADLGGTEIYEPLQSIFDDSSANKKHNKHVFLITDGNVFDPQLVIDLIKDHNDRYTTHTFGIGDGVSTELIQRCASAGLGTYAYVNDNAYGLKAKIIKAVQKSFVPFFYVTKQKLEVPFKKKLEYPKLQNTDKFYHGQYSTYLTVLDASDYTELEGKFRLKLSNSQTGEFSSFSINIAKKCKIIKGDSIFKLTAKRAIDDLMNKK